MFNLSDPPQKSEMRKAFSIKVKKDGKEKEYQVRVVKMTQALIIAGKKGAKSAVTEEDMKKLLAYEENLEFDSYEPKITFLFASPSAQWTSFKLNDESCEIQENPKFDAFMKKNN